MTNVSFLKKILICFFVLAVSYGAVFATSEVKNASLMIDGVDIEDALRGGNNTSNAPTPSKPSSSKPAAKPAPAKPAPPKPAPPKPAPPKPAPPKPAPPKPEPVRIFTKTVPVYVPVPKPVPEPVFVQTIPPAYTYNPASYPVQSSSIPVYQPTVQSSVYELYRLNYGLNVGEIRLSDNLINRIANRINASGPYGERLYSLKTYAVDPVSVNYRFEYKFSEVYFPLKDYNSLIYLYDVKYGTIEELYYKYADTGIVQVILDDETIMNRDKIVVIASFR